MADLSNSTRIQTTEMHVGGEPFRVVETGYPDIPGDTMQEKHKYLLENLQHLNRFLLFEPRGHVNMNIILYLKPCDPKADIGILVLHPGYPSSLCGEGVIAMGRYVLDKGLVRRHDGPETSLIMEVPRGLVDVKVEYHEGKTGRTRFNCPPAFAYLLDYQLPVKGYGNVKIDIGFSGKFFGVVSGKELGIDVTKSSADTIKQAGSAVSEAIVNTIQLKHPTDKEFETLTGTLVTDGEDAFSTTPAKHVPVFVDGGVDRCLCGSGTTARVACIYARGHMKIGENRTFVNPIVGSTATAMPVEETTCADRKSLVVEFSAHAHYIGTSVFTLEENDELKSGFLPA